MLKHDVREDDVWIVDDDSAVSCVGDVDGGVFLFCEVWFVGGVDFENGAGSRIAGKLMNVNFGRDELVER